MDGDKQISFDEFKQVSYSYYQLELHSASSAKKMIPQNSHSDVTIVLLIWVSCENFKYAVEQPVWIFSTILLALTLLYFVLIKMIIILPPKEGDFIITNTVCTNLSTIFVQ